MPDLSLFDLSGKKALVTGGAMGIGRICAQILAKAGADVAIIDLNEEIGTKTAASIRELGRDSLFVKCDVTQAEQIQSMIETVVRQFGRLDIAVNNAGLYRAGRDEVQPLEEWQQVINLNLTGTWLCARAEMRQMARQTPTEGKIINMASFASIRAISNGSYDASKAGVVHLSRTLAVQWGSYNINVNCVSPGYVISGMGTKTRSVQERQRLREFTPLGHVMRLEDLQGPVLFLASKASDYVTGQNLVVDGGHSLSTWMQPPPARNVPPRVDQEAELAEMRKDYAARGAVLDEEGNVQQS